MRQNPPAMPHGTLLTRTRPVALGFFHQRVRPQPSGAQPALIRLFPVLSALVFVAVLAGPVRAAGIDCSKATTPVERMLCADPALGAADKAVANAFAAALATAPDPAALRASQRQWLATRNACPDAACLLARHAERQAALRTLAASSAPAASAAPSVPAASSAPAAPAASAAPASDTPEALLAKRARLKARLNWPADCEASFQEAYAPDGTGLELLTTGVDRYDLGQGRTLYLIQCEQAAYQSVFVAMATEAGAGPARLLRFPTADADAGRITRSLEDTLVGNPVFDPAAKTLTNVTKARGVGDCGTYAVYAFAVNGDPRPLEIRARDCPKNGGKYLPPERWPLVKLP